MSLPGPSQRPPGRQAQPGLSSLRSARNAIALKDVLTLVYIHVHIMGIAPRAEHWKFATFTRNLINFKKIQGIFQDCQRSPIGASPMHVQCKIAPNGNFPLLIYVPIRGICTIWTFSPSWTMPIYSKFLTAYGGNPPYRGIPL